MSTPQKRRYTPQMRREVSEMTTQLKHDAPGSNHKSRRKLARIRARVYGPARALVHLAKGGA